MLNLIRTGTLILSFLAVVNLCSASTDQFSMISGDFLSNIIDDNNGLLKVMLIFLIVIVFGYAAKLFYERRFRKE